MLRNLLFLFYTLYYTQYILQTAYELHMQLLLLLSFILFYTHHMRNIRKKYIQRQKHKVTRKRTNQLEEKQR